MGRVLPGLLPLPEDLAVDIEYGFDSYKVTYCTVDVARPGMARPVPTVATGNVSVPRKAGPLATVAYLHGTSPSFYDAPSNPNVVGELEARGESFDGPPSSTIFAGDGFVYVAPDYLGLGDSAVPRHRYFHAATEASSAADLLAASRGVLRSLGSSGATSCSPSASPRAATWPWRCIGCWSVAVEVTATAPVGGVFDVERFFLSSIANETTVTLPLAVAHLLLASAV